MSSTTYQGGCHCGAVQYEVDSGKQLLAHRCNCSVCAMTGFLHLIVPKDQFRLLQGTESICCYTFNTGVAKHYFCKTCGIKSYYVPRSNPDGVSVNVRCLRLEQDQTITIEDFDGRNWESNAAKLKDLA